MSIVVPDVAERTLLNSLRNSLFNSNCHVHLFKNNLTPGDATVLGDFTEANFTGYAAITPSVGAAFTNGAGKAECDFATCTFSCTGSGTPNDVYGYYVTDVGNAVLYFAERAASPPTTLNANGQTYVVVPKLTLVQE